MKLMKAMSEKEIARWEKQRAKGKWFVIFRTAILASISMFVLTNLLGWISDGQTYLTPYFLVSYLVIGLLLGVTSWWTNDARYQNHVLDKKIEHGMKS